MCSCPNSSDENALKFSEMSPNMDYGTQNGEIATDLVTLGGREDSFKMAILYK